MAQSKCGTEDIKKRLKAYVPLKKEVLQLEEQIKELIASKDSVNSILIEEAPCRSLANKDRIGDLLKRIEALQELYYSKLDEMLCELYYIERTIEKLETQESRLMRKRYIENKNWYAICDEMSYSWSQIRRIHINILESLVAKMN